MLQKSYNKIIKLLLLSNRQFKILLFLEAIFVVFVEMFFYILTAINESNSLTEKKRNLISVTVAGL